MKRLICLFTDHRFVAVRPVDIWTIPDAGPTVVYEEDPVGEQIACRRCRKVWLLEDANADVQ